jgi:branched-chain amino acid aminotransferase
MAIRKLDKIWFDGKLVDWDDARVHILTHSLHYGMAAFEGIRCYRREDGRASIFRLREHLDRLYDSCKIITVKVPYPIEAMRDACLAVLRANKLAEAYLRPIVYLGDESMGIGATDVSTRVSVIAYEWGAYLGEEGLRRGIRAKVSSFARHHVNVGMTMAKLTGQYLNSILAKREALAAGYDEAIMLNVSGYVAEGSGQNIFLVKHGKLRTPPTSASILAGITRDSVLRMARDDGLPVEESSVTRDELYTADEVFFAGTATEVTPVREIDNRAIGNGEPGPITRKLQQEYFEVIKGKQVRYPEWLTFL